MTCYDNYVVEAKWQIFERVKKTKRDIKSDSLKHSLKHNHQHVLEDFQIIGNGFKGNNNKRKVAEALLIQEIKPTMNIKGQLVQFKLLNWCILITFHKLF